MSDTDSFIDEVNDEVRRDRFYFFLRRYGWIAILAVVLLVGGAAWNEYNKAQQRAQAEALGDAMLLALTVDDAALSAQALSTIEPNGPRSAALLDFLLAAQQLESGNTDAAVAALNDVALNAEVPDIYRQIAQFKAVVLQGMDTPASERRQALEALAIAGTPLRLLAEEQLALIDIEENAPDAAIARYQAILLDAEVTADLQQRALQVIVALGGEPEMGAAALPQSGTDGTDGTAIQGPLGE